ncbi:hypothetical protein DPM19_22315 [Actinomadura craniellae]|uniref:Uncharacterized protein n=1 Tax=Actinomadura craniellae TaxID=2231787 RepID=A0A365H2A1_9ACTN|nr:hypothetical protein DPM19_22315 [Actinomadura craniellae]
MRSAEQDGQAEGEAGQGDAEVEGHPDVPEPDLLDPAVPCAVPAARVGVRLAQAQAAAGARITAGGVTDAADVAARAAGRDAAINAAAGRGGVDAGLSYHQYEQSS